MVKKIRLLSSEHQNSTDTAFYVVYVLCDEKRNTLTIYLFECVSKNPKLVRNVKHKAVSQ